MHSPFTRLANGVWVFEGKTREPCLAIIKRSELLPQLALETEGDIFRLLVPPAYPGAKMGDLWSLTQDVTAAKVLFEAPAPQLRPAIQGPPATCQPSQMQQVPSVPYNPPIRPQRPDLGETPKTESPRPEAPTKPDAPSPFEGKCTRPEGHPGDCGKFSQDDIHLQSAGGKVVPSCLKPLRRDPVEVQDELNEDPQPKD